MKPIPFFLALMLIALSTVNAQTSITLVNNYSCPVYYEIYQTGTAGMCAPPTLFASGTLTVPTPPGGLVLSPSISTTGEHIEIRVSSTPAGSIAPIFSDPNCGPQNDQLSQVTDCNSNTTDFRVNVTDAVPIGTGWVIDVTH